MKKKINLIYIVSLFGLILGFILSSFTKPDWEVIWKIEINQKLNNSLLLASDFNGLIKKSDNEILLLDKINTITKNFVEKNNNFNQLKNIKISENSLRFKTSKENVQEKELKIYIDQLNDYLSKNIKTELKNLIEISKLFISQNIEAEIKKLEIFDAFLNEHNLNIFQSNLNSNNFNPNQNKFDLYENKYSFPILNIDVGSRDELKKIIKGYKDPGFKEKFIETNTSIINYNKLIELFDSNIEIFKLINLDSSINRQPKKLFMSLSSMFVVIVIYLTFVGFFPHIKEFKDRFFR